MDCEIGPIGWHDIRNQTEFYVAAEFNSRTIHLKGSKGLALVDILEREREREREIGEEV